MPSLTLAQPGMCFMSISEISTELKDVRGQWGPYCFVQTSSVPAAGLQFGHQISHLVAQLWILARPHLYWSNQWKEEKKTDFLWSKFTSFNFSRKPLRKTKSLFKIRKMKLRKVRQWAPLYIPNYITTGTWIQICLQSFCCVTETTS